MSEHDSRSPRDEPEKATTEGADFAADLLRLGLSGRGDGQTRSLIGRTFAERFRIVSRLGEGGFGDVYKAEQFEPVKRDVAIKILKGEVRGREVTARFEGERQALALMAHPHIAKVFDAGVSEEGRPFFVMELVEGESITEFCDSQGLSLVDRLLLFQKVCLAIQHAHQRGVIHRDLKPSNILVENRDGTFIPKVIDFGIAKATTPEAGGDLVVTHSNMIMGTPAYMSPEQAELGAAAVDTRSDGYSLGVIFYELVTGRLPLDFSEKSHHQIRQLIIDEEPVLASRQVLQPQNNASVRIAELSDLSPAGLASKLVGDLDAIVFCALEKDRERRYPSPRDFADDITNYLEDRPVEARAVYFGYRFLKLIKRRKQRVLGAVAALSFFIALGVGAFFGAQDRERQVATALAEGELALQEGDLLAALPPYITALRLEQGDRQKEETHRVRLGLIMDRLPALDQIWIPEIQINRGVFHPDGKRVAVACEDEKLRIYEVGSKEAVEVFEHEGDKIFDVAFSPDGKYVAGAYAPRDTVIWRLEDRETMAVISTAKPCYSVAFGGEGELILGTRSEDDQPVALFGSWLEGAELMPLRHNSDAYYSNIDAVGITSVGGLNFGVSVLLGGPFFVWDLANQKEWSRFEGGWNYWNRDFALHPREETIAITSGMEVIFISAEGGYTGKTLSHSDLVQAVDYSPDGSLIVTASYDKTARVWDARNLTSYCAPIRHDGQLLDTSFAPDSQRILTCSDSGIARVWNLETVNYTAQPVRGRSSRVGKAHYEISGTTLTLLSPKISSAIAAENGVEVAIQLGKEERVADVFSSPDGKRIVVVSKVSAGTGDDSSRLRFRVVEQGKGERIYHSQTRENGKTQLIAFDAPSFKAIYSVTSSDQSILSALDLTLGKISESPITRSQGISDFHADPSKPYHQIRGGLFAGGAGSVFYCHTAAKVFRGKIGGELELVFEAANPIYRDSFEIRHLTASRDGRLLVAGLSDNGLTDLWAIVWDLEKGEQFGERLSHDDGVVHCQFSNSGQFLATASEDSTVRVWRRENGGFKRVQVIRNDADVQRVAWSSDDRWLAAVMANRVQLWEIDRGGALGPAIQRLWGGNVQIVSAEFISNDTKLLIGRGDGRLVILPLAQETGAIDRLIPRAELISSQRNDPQFGPQPLRIDELSQLWDRLAAEQ